MTEPFDFWDRSTANREKRVNFSVETMREMSLQSDAQQMVSAYGNRMRRIFSPDAGISLSRRDLAAPKYRITRSNQFASNINPWKERDRLPIFDGGVLAKLIYGNVPVV